MLSQLGVHVVGVASTIDNDLLGTDISIGCDTPCGGSIFGNVEAKVTHELGRLGSSQITLFAG